MDMRLKLPPPLLWGLAITLMWALARYFPVVRLSQPWQTPAALLLALLAVAIGVAGLLAFHRAGTTHSPVRVDATCHLVSNGVYGFSRNPMYLGLVMLLLAASLYWGALTPLVVIPLFVAALSRWQIEPEEQVLTDKFGDQYRAYCQQVRRWL